MEFHAPHDGGLIQSVGDGELEMRGLSDALVFITANSLVRRPGGGYGEYDWEAPRVGVSH